MAILRGGIAIVQEEAIGTVNGLNDTFTTTSPFVLSTLKVALNGLVQLNPDDFIELTNQSFQLVQVPIGGLDPDRIVVQYQKV